MPYDALPGSTGLAPVDPLARHAGLSQAETIRKLKLLGVTVLDDGISPRYSYSELRQAVDRLKRQRRE